MKNGLEIGRKAELYAYERNLQASIDNFKTALSILVPLLGQEPKGLRQELLHKQVIDYIFIDLYLYFFIR